MSRDMVYEDVPRLERRTGDQVLANQNNATILLGRDRAGSVETGYGSLGSSTKGRGAGSIHLMVGRKGPDPSLSDDSATVYLSARSDPDDQAGTSTIGTVSRGVPAAIVRADCIRIVPRTDLKVSVGGTYAALDGSSATVESQLISLGKGAADAAVRGTTYRTAEDALVNAIAGLVTAIGTYAAAIQPVADVPNVATPVLTAAIAVFQAAVSTFVSGGPSYLSQKVRLV